MMDAFPKINREGATILMVTHDSRIAAMCDRIKYLLDGEIRGGNWYWGRMRREKQRNAGSAYPAGRKRSAGKNSKPCGRRYEIQ